MTDSPSTTSMDLFVGALVGIGGQLVSTINHMLAYPAPPDADSIPDVLRKLLTDVFNSALDAADSDLERAAFVLTGAGEAIQENLFLVDLSLLQDHSGRRHGAGARSSSTKKRRP